MRGKGCSAPALTTPSLEEKEQAEGENGVSIILWHTEMRTLPSRCRAFAAPGADIFEGIV